MEGRSKVNRKEELEDEAFVKAAFHNTQQQLRRTHLHRASFDTRQETGLLLPSNRYLKTDFASRLAQLERASGLECSRAGARELSPEPEVAKGPWTKRQTAATRLYEMKLHRARAMEGSSPAGYRQKMEETQDTLSVEEETDKVSIMSVGSTPSSISEASTKVFKEPLSNSTWKPLRMSRNMVARRIQGVGLLHVDGPAGHDRVDLSLRDTYQQPKIESRTDENGNRKEIQNQIRICTDTKELRRLLKLNVHIPPNIDSTCSVSTHEGKDLERKPSTLDAEQWEHIFQKLNVLRREADDKELETPAVKGDTCEQVFCDTAHIMDTHPEVKARFERLALLSKHADSMFESIS